MNKKLKKIIITILAVIMLIVAIGNTVKAVIDETKKVSLTITKYEHSNGSEENKELAGVEFTVSLVPNETGSVDEAVQYIENNTVTNYTKTTPENGTIKFENLEQGRYLVQETNAPKNVATKIENFLIDLPRTNDNGDGWDYDVTIYPKNITIYGTVTLNQVTQDGEILENAIWELQKMDESQQWNKYDYQGELSTDKNGKIQIQNLEVGKYRFIQTQAEEGYILDKSGFIEFEIDTKNIEYEFTVINERLEIQKQILQDDGTYSASQSAFKTDINSWKITTDVADIISKMELYKIKDELPDGLSYRNDSIKVYGINKNNEQVEISKDFYKKELDMNTLEISFYTEKLKGYKNIIIKYNTEFNDSISYGEFKNKAYLIYTDYIEEDGTSKSEYTISSEAEVYTGAVLIYKTDEKGNPLKGATFKIAKSKEQAKAGVFITDKEGIDITAVSDENGYVIFDGLKYDTKTSYWIVEVQAPSYEEDGEIKYYNLLQKPVEVKVDSRSQNYSKEDTTVVINKKQFVLPVTGGTLSIGSSILGLVIICSTIIIKKRKLKCQK